MEVVTHLYNDDSVAASETYNVATRYGHSSSVPCHNSLISMSQQSHSNTTSLVPMSQQSHSSTSSLVPMSQQSCSRTTSLDPMSTAPFQTSVVLFFSHVTAAMIFLWEKVINRVFVCSQGTGIFGLR